jgi:molecular chaperone Hsp33
MSDYIIRGTSANHQVRFFAATTKDTVEKARGIHNTSPVATAALGRLLTAGAMMGTMNKNDDDLVTIQIQCQGPIGGLCVTADTKANVKGYVHNPDVMLPISKEGKLDVGGALDLGVMSVIKDIGLKEPYVGQTHLVSGEIAEDLTYYFATSEQIPTSVALGVLMNKNNTVAQAGGFIIQLMPFAEEEVIASLEKKIGEMKSITSLLDQGMSPEDIINHLLGEFGVEINDTISTQYECNCSRERVSKAIISIGKKDLQEMIDEGKPIEVNCHFCGSNYEFTVDELKEML